MANVAIKDTCVPNEPVPNFSDRNIGRPKTPSFSQVHYKGRHIVVTSSKMPRNLSHNSTLLQLCRTAKFTQIVMQYSRAMSSPRVKMHFAVYWQLHLTAIWKWDPRLRVRRSQIVRTVRIRPRNTKQDSKSRKIRLIYPTSQSRAFSSQRLCLLFSKRDCEFYSDRRWLSINTWVSWSNCFVNEFPQIFVKTLAYAYSRTCESKISL